MMSNFPLILKEETTTTFWTLEGKQIEKKTCNRRIRPSKKIETKEDIDAYIEQMGIAKMKYKNFLELPYCTEYPVAINHPLYDYAVSEMDSLSSKSQEKPLPKVIVDADLIIQGELEGDL